MRQLFLQLSLIFLCASASAVTREDVNAGAQHLYDQRLEEARQGYELDADPVFLGRVRTIAATLISQAQLEQVAATDMQWEIHTSTSPDENASCMAGGKLLIGEAHIARLNLNDAELAMLIAHEIEHALLEHNLKEMREALRLEPERQNQYFPALEYAIDHDESLMAKLDAFNAAQEMEADREGLLLASRAGWPAADLVNYFKKLTRADPMANFDRREHPAPARRWQAMRELLKQIESGHGAEFSK